MLRCPVVDDSVGPGLGDSFPRSTRSTARRLRSRYSHPHAAQVLTYMAQQSCRKYKQIQGAMANMRCVDAWFGFGCRGVRHQSASAATAHQSSLAWVSCAVMFAFALLLPRRCERGRGGSEFDLAAFYMSVAGAPLKTHSYAKLCEFPRYWESSAQEHGCGQNISRCSCRLHAAASVTAHASVAHLVVGGVVGSLPGAMCSGP